MAKKAKTSALRRRVVRRVKHRAGEKVAKYVEERLPSGRLTNKTVNALVLKGRKLECDEVARISKIASNRRLTG